MFEINNNILQTIKMLIEKKLSTLSFDKTIMAIVVQNINDKDFKVKYMDNEFIAYKINPSLEVQVGDCVFVTILNNNFSSEKIIIGVK